MGRHPLSAEEVEAQRARVVQAAEKLFAANGYQGVTLRALARVLGQSATAAYRYFDGKAAIFTAARIAAYQRFAEAQEQASREARDPADRLTRLGDAYLRFGLEQPDAYRLMFELKPPDGTTRPELRDAAFRSWSPLRESIGEAVRAGLLAGDPEELTHLFWAGLHGILSLHLADKLTHGMDLADLQGPMKRLMFVGSSAAASDPD